MTKRFRSRLPVRSALITVCSVFAATVVSASASAETPQEAYAAWCGRCHNFTGKGVPGLYPGLDGSLIVTADAKLLARLVLDGGFANNAMPAFREVLNDQQAAEILSYIRTSWSNKASPITPAEIAARNEP
jgi:mono/diheme cytochrome c family protein